MKGPTSWRTLGASAGGKPSLCAKWLVAPNHARPCLLSYLSFFVRSPINQNQGWLRQIKPKSFIFRGKLGPDTLTAHPKTGKAKNLPPSKISL